MKDIKDKLFELIDLVIAGGGSISKTLYISKVLKYIGEHYVPKEGYEFLRAGYDSLNRDYGKLKAENEENKKLVYASCVKQKELCLEEAKIKITQSSRYAREEHTVDEDSILNAPLPTEVERHFSTTELKNIVDMAIDCGYYAGDVEHRHKLNEKFYDVLLKEYQIKF